MNLSPSLPIHLQRLVETRMLMTANSGAGKSWALRRLLEQTHGKIQQLVIDPEGEFYTLREKYDYILAGRGGDCPAEPRSAALLARRLLELGESAILDLYELAPRDRVRFVRAFLEALIDAPRALWHQVLVVIDEAHAFAPEKGHGEAESAEAVARLMAQGRKRGFAGVLATQRLSKLAKDVAAEANNLLIGRAALDVDLKRAAEALGLAKSDWPQIRSLPAGDFFAFGPALSETVKRVTIGPVQTAHPKAGARAAPPAPPREKVRAILAQLADLPKEAEAEARTATELREKLRALERELAAARRAPASILRPDPAAVEMAKEAARLEARRLHQQQMSKVVASAEAGRGRAARAIDQALDQLKRAADALREPIDLVEIDPSGLTGKTETTVIRARNVSPAAPARERAADSSGRRMPEESMSPRRQRILDAIATAAVLYEDAPRELVALLAGTGHWVSTFERDLGAMRQSEGLIEYRVAGTMRLTDAGAELARARDLIEADVHQSLLAQIVPRRQRIMSALLAQRGEEITREDLAEAAGTNANVSTFERDLGWLRSTAGWIDYPSPGRVVALPVLFLEGR